MKIKLGSNQPKPKYQTEGAAAFDLVATRSVFLSNRTEMMDLEIAVEIPSGYYGKLVPRSSMGKRGIALSNTLGVIDSDYRGNIHAPLYCRFNEGAHVKKGERIVQLLICKVEQFDLEVVDGLSETKRGAGGFGSTNK
ncbi:dUTPase [Vibrio phage 1.110.O._10N.261.52.C1]|nr:dUTPase [Vibrio phage 1.110.O._10N.261.52.C1]